jgi:hypothetical protein
MKNKFIWILSLIFFSTLVHADQCIIIGYSGNGNNYKLECYDKNSDAYTIEKSDLEVADCYLYSKMREEYFYKPNLEKLYQCYEAARFAGDDASATVIL